MELIGKGLNFFFTTMCNLYQYFKLSDQVLEFKRTPVSPCYRWICSPCLLTSQRENSRLIAVVFRIICLLILIAAISIPAQFVFAREDSSITFSTESQTETAGGNGGSKFIQHCPEGSFLVGISGDIVSSFEKDKAPSALKLICGSMSKKSSDLKVMIETASIGGAGDSSFSSALVCPKGSAVKKILAGIEDDYGFSRVVRSLKIECRPIGTGVANTIGPVGSVLAESYGALDCQDKLITGLFGRSSVVVNQLGAYCS